MSSAIVAAQQRRSCLLASTFFVPILSLGISAAEAQQSASPSPLPPIEISSPGDENRTRAKPLTDEGSGSRREWRNGCPAIQRHRRRIHIRDHVRGYCALARSNGARDHRADSRGTTDELIRRRKWREDQCRPPRIWRVRHLQYPPPHQRTPGQ